MLTCLKQKEARRAVTSPLGILVRLGLLFRLGSLVRLGLLFRLMLLVRQRLAPRRAVTSPLYETQHARALAMNE